jgi:hypothetical protein
MPKPSFLFVAENFGVSTKTIGRWLVAGVQSLRAELNRQMEGKDRDHAMELALCRALMEAFARSGTTCADLRRDLCGG